MVERERTVRTGEVASAVGMSPASIQAYARDGLLPHRVTPGGHYRFNLDEVREVLDPLQVREVEDLMDVFAGTGEHVDALSGYRPSPFTEAATARLRGRAHHGGGLTRPRQEVTASAGASELVDLVERSGATAAVAVLHRG